MMTPIFFKRTQLGERRINEFRRRSLRRWSPVELLHSAYFFNHVRHTFSHLSDSQRFSERVYQKFVSKVCVSHPNQPSLGYLNNDISLSRDLTDTISQPQCWTPLLSPISRT